MNPKLADLSLPLISEFLRENPLALTRILADLQSDKAALDAILAAAKAYNGERRAEAATTAKDLAAVFH